MAHSGLRTSSAGASRSRAPWQAPSSRRRCVGREPPPRLLGATLPGATGWCPASSLRQSAGAGTSCCSAGERPGTRSPSRGRAQREGRRGWRAVGPKGGAWCAVRASDSGAAAPGRIPGRIQLARASAYHRADARRRSAKELKASYRRLAKRVHPDKTADPRATLAFKTLRDAFDLLSDESQRERCAPSHYACIHTRPQRERRAPRSRVSMRSRCRAREVRERGGVSWGSGPAPARPRDAATLTDARVTWLAATSVGQPPPARRQPP